MIGFDLSEHQEQIKAEAAEFAAKYITPRAAEIDKTDESPVDIWQAMSKAPFQYTGMNTYLCNGTSLLRAWIQIR